MNELALHRRIVGLLKAYGARRMVFWHTPNGEKRDRRAAAKLVSMGVRPGVPDLTIIVDGRPWSIEIKGLKGRLSKEQDVFIADAAEAGMPTILVRSLEEAIGALNHIGALRVRLTLSDARDGAESIIPSPRRTRVPA